jgi:hypothetical protein
LNEVLFELMLCDPVKEDLLDALVEGRLRNVNQSVDRLEEAGALLEID